MSISTLLARALDYILVPRVSTTDPRPPLTVPLQPSDRTTAMCACGDSIESWPVGVTYICDSCMERRR